MSEIIPLRSAEEQSTIEQTIQLKKLLDSIQTRLQALLVKNPEEITYDDHQTIMMNEIFTAKNDGLIHLPLYTAAEYFTLLVASHLEDDSSFHPHEDYARKRSFMQAADQHFLMHVFWERPDITHPLSIAQNYYYEASKQMHDIKDVEFCDALILSTKHCWTVLQWYIKEMMQPQLVRVQ